MQKKENTLDTILTLLTDVRLHQEELLENQRMLLNEIMDLKNGQKRLQAVLMAERDGMDPLQPRQGMLQ